MMFMKKLTDTTKNKKEDERQNIVFYLNKKDIIDKINKA